ncbi:MAG: hypothetical protein Unbinned4098contig1000_35 [Prokaryotic dsDNA virus sp.]|nr:MAG: hypothetical protein Unbinned4098contig1000_35 [Prokaryotic dsDNA virus sp.]|tara:strand:- start:14668 stop:14958 length:291 start_codon:yes stop_codon:yes gene_type:complete
MAFTEDLTQYFDTNDFGVEASFTSSGTAYTAKGIFDNLYSEDLSVNGTVPTFTCVESDVTNLAVDAVCTINSTNYIVRVKKPDGTGITMLVLEKSI